MSHYNQHNPSDGLHHVGGFMPMPPMPPSQPAQAGAQYQPPIHPGYAPSYMTPPVPYGQPGPPPLQYPSGNYYPAPPPFPPAASSPYPNQYPPAFHGPPPPMQVGGGPFYYLGAEVPGVNPYAPGYDAEKDYNDLRKATKGFGTDNGTVVRILSPRTPVEMKVLANTFQKNAGKNMLEMLNSETSGYYRETIRGLVLGPVDYDVHLLRDAIKGIGTKEGVLNEILFDRSNEDLRTLISAYRTTTGKDLVRDVQGDLSGKTERLFNMVLAAGREPDGVPVVPTKVEDDTIRLYNAGQGKIGTDEIKFFEIIVNSSRPHLAAICENYRKKYGKTLPKVIKEEFRFSPHIKSALLFIVKGVNPKHAHLGYGDGVWRDAKLLNEAMKGMGTKDMLLVMRVVRFHWNRPRMEAIKRAFEAKYHKSLEVRVASEISGWYKTIITSLIQGPK